MPTIPCNAGSDGRCNAGTRAYSFADPIYTKPPDVSESGQFADPIWRKKIIKPQN
jgi:hypothetical protein